VDKYSFWQSENDDIIGYLEFESADDDEEELIKAKRSSTGLMITLWKETEKDDTTRFCNSGAQALIRRVSSYIDSDAAIENKSLNISMMTLLNVSSASRRLYSNVQVCMLLTRLDNLAHVLIWSSANVRDAGDVPSIDLIELPGMNFSFKAKEVEMIDNKITTVAILTSTEPREIVDKLVGLISHFIVLQNSDNDLFVLMPGCALPRRLNTDGTAFSVQVIFDRRNEEWIDNMDEVRCYFYPIHNSQGKKI